MQIYLHRKTIRDITDKFETFSVISREGETDTWGWRWCWKIIHKYIKNNSAWAKNTALRHCRK